MPIRARGAGVVLDFAFPGIKTHQVCLGALGQTRLSDRLESHLTWQLTCQRLGGSDEPRYQAAI
jgi:hypothetical protein